MTEAAVAFAALITALATLISVSVAGYVAVKSLKRTEKTVQTINHAVNGTEPSERSLRENIQDLHDDKFVDEPIAPLVRQIAALLESANREG